MKGPIAVAAWFGRTAAITFLVLAGSTLLVRLAPGYLSDAREMDSRFAGAARAELSVEAARSRSVFQILAAEFDGWRRGDGGISRQFGVPVLELVRPRLAVTALLLFKGLALGWLLAVSAALISSAAGRAALIWQAPATILLAVPTAAMATLCLLADCGGPVLVMALLLAARDFKFLHQALRKARLDPSVLHARAQGIAMGRVLWAHILPALAPQLSALASLSIVTALSAIVPVEVIFSVPGLGQLAWSAAMNRDLPVLLAITGIMALAVTASGMARSRASEWESA
jgi:peptide/nickel transport system permease protein